MGLGNTPLGLLCVLGADPVQVVAAGPSSTPPTALQFDPSTRQFVQNADGTMASIHPVDQRVALAIFIEEDSIGSQTTLGNKLRKLLERIDPNKVVPVATAEIKRVLQTMIDAGDVILVGVTVDQSVTQRVGLAVTYVNTRLPTFNPQSPLADPTSLPI